MELSIGRNIRELRKENNITQEKLAEYLYVSYQTISKWENGTALPSVAMLPAIANFFNVSIDELYDFKKNSDNAKLLQYESEYTEYCTKGDNEARVKVMRKALKEYPRNYKFMNLLARSLYRCGMIEQHGEEIIELCDRILEDCKTDCIRFSAMQTIARVYNKLGQQETALSYADKMPSMASSKEFFVGEILTGEERIKQLQENVFFLAYNTGKAIIDLAHDRGMDTQLTFNEKVKMYEAANAIYKVIADNGNCLTLNGKFYWHYRWIAMQYCLMGKLDLAMENLIKAERAAVEIDSFILRGKKEKYTSVMLDRVEADPRGLLKHWQGCHCAKLYKQLHKECFDRIRELPEFKELLCRLEKEVKNYAKT